MRAVASSSTTTCTSRTSSRANATSCSSPAESVVPPGPSNVSSPSGRPATQSSRRSSRTAASTSARGTSEKSAMFSASVPARTSVRCVTTPTAARSFCRSIPATSRPPRKTEPGSGSTARDSSDASVDLPEPVRPTRATVSPAGTRRFTPCRAKVPSAYEKCRSRSSMPTGPSGRSSPPVGSGSTDSICRMRVMAPRPSWMSGRWWTRLSTCPTNMAVTRKRVTRSWTRIPPPEAIAAPATATAASSAASTSPARRSIRDSTRTTSANLRCTWDERWARRRIANGCPRLVRRSLRAATASSKAAAWSVQAASSITLRREISPSIGRTRRPASAPSTGNRTHAGHHVTPATTHIGTTPTTVRPAPHSCRRTSVPTACVSSSTRSSTSPTACSVRVSSGWCSAAVSRSPRSFPSARSTTPAHTTCPAVSNRAAPTTQIARSASSAPVGSSARRPATTVPSAVPTAPSVRASSATAATGPRRRRQSRRRDGSVGRSAAAADVRWSGRVPAGASIMA